MPIQTKDIHPDGLAPSVINGLIADPWRRKIYVGSATRYAVDRDNSGLLPKSPLKTLKWWAEHSPQDGDLVLIDKGHVENLNEVDAIPIPIGLSDVVIIGLGEGTRRPTFTFITDILASWTPQGPGLLLANLNFVCGIDGQLEMLNVNSAGARLLGLHFAQGAGTMPVVCVQLAGLALRCVIDGCSAAMPAAGTDSFINFGANHDLTIRDCFTDGIYTVTAAPIHNASTANRVQIHNNRLINRLATANTAAIRLAAATNGWINDNVVGSIQAGTGEIADLIVSAGCHRANNKGADSAALFGIDVGTTDA